MKDGTLKVKDTIPLNFIVLVAKSYLKLCRCEDRYARESNEDLGVGKPAQWFTLWVGSHEFLWMDGKTANVPWIDGEL